MCLRGSAPHRLRAQGGFVCVQNASLTPPLAEFIPVQLDLSTVPFVLIASRLYDDDCLNSPQTITSYILTHRLSDKRSCSVWTRLYTRQSPPFLRFDTR
jgi:hypothetical protein